MLYVLTLMRPPFLLPTEEALLACFSGCYSDLEDVDEGG